MNRLTTCVALLMALWPCWALAADPDGRFAIKGAGAADCARYLVAIEQDLDELRLFIGWIDGYVSAANEMMDDTYDLASFESPRLLAELLRSHCANHRDQAFHTAVGLMARALAPSRLPLYSEWLDVEHDGQQARLYTVTLQRAQERLTAAGLYDGEAHGRFDRATRRAFERFQKARSIPVTSIPDVGTLSVLLRE